MTFGCLPVKSPARSKERLSHYLSREHREQLARAMFEDVLMQARQVRGLDRLVVVSNDAQVMMVAAAAGAMILVESEQRSHGASADWAAIECMKRGARTVMFIPIDVPLVTAAEMQSLLDASRAMEQPHLVIVPSSDGTGTNAMVQAPPNLIQNRFGPNSFAAHVSQAEAKHATVRVMHPAGLVFDLDTPADLSLFLAKQPQGRAADLLRSIQDPHAA